MLDIALLQMRQSKNAAGEYTPQLLLPEIPVLQMPLLHLIIESLIGIFKKRIDFIESPTELILRPEQILYLT